MSRTFYESFTFQLPDEDDVEAEVEFTCTPPVAATYWQPAEGMEIELINAYRIADGGSLMPGLPQAEVERCEQHLRENFQWEDDDDYGYDG